MRAACVATFVALQIGSGSTGVVDSWFAHKGAMSTTSRTTICASVKTRERLIRKLMREATVASSKRGDSKRT
jgi:hypothetical protein